MHPDDSGPQICSILFESAQNFMNFGLTIWIHGRFYA